jgi:hypothetical protein
MTTSTPLALPRILLRKSTTIKGMWICDSGPFPAHACHMVCQARRNKLLSVMDMEGISTTPDSVVGYRRGRIRHSAGLITHFAFHDSYCKGSKSRRRHPYYSVTIARDLTSNSLGLLEAQGPSRSKSNLTRAYGIRHALASDTACRARAWNSQARACDLCVIRERHERGAAQFVEGGQIARPGRLDSFS